MNYKHKVFFKNLRIPHYLTDISVQMDSYRRNMLRLPTSKKLKK